MRHAFRSSLALVSLITSLSAARLMAAAADIPADAVNDAVMARPSEIALAHEWAAVAFTGAKPTGGVSHLDLEVRRQDHNVLTFGESCMDTPIQIGPRKFAHGLGTHAASEIAVTLPAGAKAFKAFVGVDNNFDTQGKHGSVQFIVEIGGKEAFRTPTLRGGAEPLEIKVDIPDGTTQLVLKVDPTADGVSHDQADWADARIVLQDGTALWLDDNQFDSMFLGADPPFSFVYGGTPSAALLKTWDRKTDSKDLPDRTQYEVRWTDPKTQLCVTAIVGVFKKYPAIDWVLSFENRGSQDTPIIEKIQALDVGLRTGFARRPAVIHTLEGDACGERSFLPAAHNLDGGKSVRFAPSGGRPSNTTAFPFWNVQYANRGVITAVGWSGQWAASFDRAENGPGHMRAGMELTHLLLHPGERIRSPRILVMPWKGDRLAAHNRFRRLLLFHYVPKRDGKPSPLPFVSQCFDRYSWSAAHPEWATEAGQIAAAEFAAKIGCTHHWLDAAWFVGGFPNGVGNWFCKPKEFPNGLKPVGDACHRLGIKFVLWFEPERVAPGTEIAREHPDFVFGGTAGGLFKLNDPAARRWLTDLLSKRITEYGIDIYRNDFNIDPLGFWRKNDTPDRQGMTEIRYVEGHYGMWDELLTRHPGLQIDNCASGGRRIDLETIQRSFPLWRSDTSCSPGHPEWNQAQTFGLSLYIPFHTACGWTPEPYDFRSSATAGAICQWDYLNPTFPMDLAKATMAEAKENATYWYGDFYPLSSCTQTLDHWAAYQFHRPDLNAGLVLAFRRPESPYTALGLALQALNPATTYEVEFIDDARAKTVKKMTGRELTEQTELRMPKKGSSLVVRYRPAK